MESSSDDSFAWTNASNDSSDSDEMAAGTYNKNQHDDESESGKSYKKKLHKELFSNNDQHTDSFDGQTIRKRKIKTEKMGNDSYESADKDHNNMKIEPETNGTHNSSQESLSYDESYLDLRVKEEQIFGTPKLKKIRNQSNASVYSDSNELELSDHTKQKKAKKNKKNKSGKLSSIDTFIENDNSITQNIEEVNAIQVKKKKKKFIEGLEFCDNVDNKLSSEIILSDIDHTENISVTELNITSNNVSVINDKSLSKINTIYSSMSDEDSKRQDRDQYPQQISKLHKNTRMPLNDSLVLPDKTSQRTPKISDRIRFEDEGEDDNSKMDTSLNPNSLKGTLTSKVKRFLKANTNLKPILLQSKSNVSLTEDDELWILRCPYELNIKSLQDINLKLDGKSKIKIEGKTYEGFADEDDTRVAILTSEHSKSVIKNLPLKGIVDLRRKIPKAHYPEDNIMVNNQTNFIPLPETKCRHPLFGSHYKKAIKIPAVVAERLKESCNQSVYNLSEKRKKKKQKHNQIESSELVIEAIPEPEPESVAKKKKRKHTDNEETPKKAKRIKYNPESAEAWESEKAIEENLFNF